MKVFSMEAGAQSCSLLGAQTQILNLAEWSSEVY